MGSSVPTEKTHEFGSYHLPTAPRALDEANYTHEVAVHEGRHGKRRQRVGPIFAVELQMGKAEYLIRLVEARPCG
jgi:hypothetical protein